MQKKLIALAVAGLMSGAAFAQSNVTIYGVADVGFFAIDGADKTVHGLSSGDQSGMQTSRLGFKGEEDLGNGLKAIFNYETKVVPDDSTGVWGSSRQAWVGLTSANAGTFRIGVQSDLTDDWIGGPTEYLYNMSASTLLGQEDGNFSNRKVQGISYKSPLMGGFQLGAGYYAPSETDTSIRQEYYMLGGTYANGPLALAATYAYLDDNLVDSSQAWAVSGSWDFKILKLMAGYYLTQDTCTANGNPLGNCLGANTVRNLDNAMWQIGAQIPVGAVGTIALGYGQKMNDLDNTDTEAFSIGYMHQLSKRTALYAAYAYMNNDANSTFRPGVGGAGAQGQFTTNLGDATFNGLALGINHKF